METDVSFEDILEAAARIKPFVHRTPVLTSRSINSFYGATLFFKCENFQRSGSFKMRGATNAVFSLRDPDASKGVATHSSGNHAGALALAASLRGIPCYVVMPENAREVKKQAARFYGAFITYCQPTLKAREKTLEVLLKETGATFVHPYNDKYVISGQGTAALELLDQVPDLNAVVVPVGGGGLLAGTAIAVATKSPDTIVVAGEPEKADDAMRSLKEGRIVVPENPDTIADGLRTSLGTITFAIIRRLVRAIYPVGEESIVDSMRHLWERMKIVVEPSSAVALAAVKVAGEELRGKRVGIILTGGNVDLGNLPF